MFRRFRFAAVLFALAGCGGEKQPPAADERGGAEEAPERRSAPAAPAGDETAPDEFAVRLDTTAGEIVLDVHRDWAPRGADRFYTLVERGYYEDVAFFRVIDGFMAQAGVHGDPAINEAWRARRIDDDPVRQSNTRGRVAFAMAGPDSRTTQFFISFGDNSKLDGMGFAPFAEVRDMAAVDALYAGYGECAPKGSGPSQRRAQLEGNAYLKKSFPKLDYIRAAEIID